MERCDFSSVITTIRKYISDDRNLNQIDLLYELFAGFISDASSSDFDFDNGLVCRWFNGQAKISPRISGFYRNSLNRIRLYDDIERNILPLMYDDAMAVQEVYRILMQDSTISQQQKQKLSKVFPCKNARAQAVFLADVLCFGMERTFVKRDVHTKNLLADGALSPVLKDFVYDSGVPKPCKHFCGRDAELVALHELLCDNEKVLLEGIAGIGKSELAKAYAGRYGKEYTNILYLTYTGDLKQTITDMDFADDLPEDSEEERFRRHNRFLRTLKEDTLLIIDHFNVTAEQDGFLSVVLKYRCQVLFTTRSHFENFTFMKLEEISDRQALLHLIGCFYADAPECQPILGQIIDTVHSHTLAVELAARLLETGILEPMALLNKLKQQNVAMDAADTIGITKDGKSSRATYRDHIRTLFSLYRLSDEELDIMRNLALIPVTGIRSRLFAGWMKLRDLNTVNELIEKGFIQADAGRVLLLHPMIQEVAMDETKPSVRNCRILLDSLQQICLRHGEEVPYYRKLFEVVESIIVRIRKDDAKTYQRFLEDVFPYMEKYHDVSGMELVRKELASLLEQDAIGTVSDRALLLDYRAACEPNPEKAIELEKEAVALLSGITADNALLASNLYANLGGLYKQVGRIDLAKQSMEQGLRLLEQFGLMAYHDSFAQIINYAVLLTDMGQMDVGLSVLQKLAQSIWQHNTDLSIDYAMVQEAMGGICLTAGDVHQATAHFKKAMAVYEVLFASEPEVIEAKKQKLMKIYVRAGLYLGRKILENK